VLTRCAALRAEGPFITQFDDGDMLMRSALGNTYYARGAPSHPPTL
jgi:hypothetical protein